jgi:quercetin dioxygenase-like cupin family protein
MAGKYLIRHAFIFIDSMNIKINDATSNRPEGHRLIDAPAIAVNVPDFVRQLKDEKAWATSDRNAITVFKNPGVTVVVCALHKGAEMNDLQIDELLMLQVIEGAVTVKSDSGNSTLTEKQMLILQSGSVAGLYAVEETIFQLSYIKIMTAPGESIL